MNKKIIYAQTNKDDKVYRTLTDIPEKLIHTRFLNFGTDKSNLFKAIVPAPLEFPKDVAIVYFPSGNIWTRATNSIHNENLTRYKYMRELHIVQLALSANEQKG